MKKDFRIEGMACEHCRKSVEEALNRLDGAHATVTLHPPLAAVEFINEELPLEKLQEMISEAGDFTVSFC